MDFQPYKKDVPRQTSDSRNEICKCTVCVLNRRMFLFFYIFFSRVNSLKKGVQCEAICNIKK